MNDAEVVDAAARQRETVPGQVLAITGKGIVVQAGTGQLLLTDFAVEGSRMAALAAMSGGSMPVVLG